MVVLADQRLQRGFEIGLLQDNLAQGLVEYAPTPEQVLIRLLFEALQKRLGQGESAGSRLP